MNGSKSPARQQPVATRSDSESVDGARRGRESNGPPDPFVGAAQSDVVEFEFTPVTASEVRTKLELARTFLDMGDPASARHMLDEVLEEGDSVLKQEAQRLIDSMP
jgi:FimV-like protein